MSLVKITFTSDFLEAQKGECLEHIEATLKRGLPTLQRLEQTHGGTFAVVGSGPSLKDHLEILRHAPKDWFILSVNESHDYLVDNGVMPHGWIFIEVAKWEGSVCKRHAPGCKYFVASQCHPDIFDYLKDRDVMVWHALQEIGEAELLNQYEGGGMLVAGGSTPPMRALNLGLVLGFQKFEMFGVDGSYEDESHVTEKAGEVRDDWKPEPTFDVTCIGRTFKTKPYLARQASDFDAFIRRFHHLFTLRTHGDGLMQHIHRSLYPQFYTGG